MAVVDKRRRDARVPVNSEPFIFTSMIIDKSDAGDTVILKDFLKDDGTYLVSFALAEVLEACDGSASLVVGTGTMATAAAGTITAVDADQLLVSADITEATIGLYGQSGSDLATKLAAGVATIIKGADTTVPVLYATLTSTSQTTGKIRIHVGLQKIPVA